MGGDYQLQSVVEQIRRNKMLTLPHIQPLVDYLESMKVRLGGGFDTPMFDPCDGGIHSKALFLLEAPGPKAVGSGFISRNNPDPSARNMNKLLSEAGFERGDVLLWNIVPWYVGTGDKIRPVKISDIERALPFLKILLTLLSDLRVIILVGKKAQKAKKHIQQVSNVPLVSSYHTGNQSLNREPDRYSGILANFKEARQFTM